MLEPPVATPPPNPTNCDSLTADIVLADDGGGSTIFPADSEALALFLAEQRQLEGRPAPKTREPKS